MTKIITSIVIIFCLVLAAGIFFEFKQNRVNVPVSPITPVTPAPTSMQPSNIISTTQPGTVRTPIKPLVHLKWGAYVGDAKNSLSNFETLVGKKVNILATFSGWDNDFPSYLSTTVGQAGKTLLVFWEPSFGYDNIADGSHDEYIKKFADDAKTYKYPVILVPFAEMNLNEEAWGYGQNKNTADKFKAAWIRIHNLFADAKNVKFGLAYNNVSIPDVPGNRYGDYYPGAAYVDYVGVDGFNFDDPPLTFSQIFDAPMQVLQTFHKPIYIFSMGDIAGPDKDTWIKDGLGYEVKTYPNLVGWIWFNQGGTPNWLVNSDPDSLNAFKSVIP